MSQKIDLVLSVKDASNEDRIKQALRNKLQVSHRDSIYFRMIRKSIDARRPNIKVNLQVEAFVNEKPSTDTGIAPEYKYVENKEKVIIVGAGPAGLFAALKLLELGYCPIVLERGKDVSSRKRDIAKIHRHHEVDPNSNYGFGEGGAGTFSDGKLYTRSKKRGNVQRILELLHFHGAKENILYEAHPHIGTDKLPKIISNIRETIIEHGGEVHFNFEVKDFLFQDKKITGVESVDGTRLEARAVILATGHSAREIYMKLHKHNVLLEPKAFAMGVRVEHPQELIDSIQYHRKNKDGMLPSASYRLVNQVNDRGVYSFCMCPGGFVVPAATAPDELVVNGMSPSERNSPFANSGIVVETRLEDLPGVDKDPVLAGLHFQMNLEKQAFQQANRTQKAPSQRLLDFVEGRNSKDLPKTSYIPGMTNSDLHNWLPKNIGPRLQEGFRKFDRKMRGFLTNEAIILGVESRTSSPIRIPRDRETYQHPQIEGLYPCGEGAGYAGGIASSAMDGENCAERLVEFLKGK